MQELTVDQIKTLNQVIDVWYKLLEQCARFRKVEPSKVNNMALSLNLYDSIGHAMGESINLYRLSVGDTKEIVSIIEQMALNKLRDAGIKISWPFDGPGNNPSKVSEGE